MLLSIVDSFRKMAAEAPAYKLAGVTIFFSAPNPRRPETAKSLTRGKEPAKEANFQWVAYQVLFSKDMGEEEPDYYIYSMGLTPEGKTKMPNKVFKSDSKWSGKNKDIPDPSIPPGEVIRAFPELLKHGESGGPNLNPAKVTPTLYKNTEKTDLGEPYSSDDFKKFFDNNFYIVVDLHSKELKNPFGKMVGMQYPEKKTPEEVAVKVAMEKMVQDYGKKTEQPDDEALTGGFDIVKQIFKHPVPMKKVG